jgi:GTP-binding protein
VVDTVMDNNAIEKERGITILAKNCAVTWQGTHINIVDTPGHADFGGEVERALSMVDGVVLLIDAQEGPMPQTRFVTKKALALGLKPILVVNKVDKPGARPDYVVNAAFDLFDKLGATDEQLDFPVVYASGINGWSSMQEGAPGEQWGPDMSALFNTVLSHVPAQQGDPAAPLQLQISALDFSTFVGRIGVGRISAGTIKPSMDVLVMEGPDGRSVKGRINQVLTFQGLERVQTLEAGPGEIVLINAYIPEYGPANRFNHEPRRPRKLLLHRRQIDRFFGAIGREGQTLIPTKLYFDEKGRVKLELCLAKGKKLHDKRATEADRDWKREQGRIMRDRG